MGGWGASIRTSLDTSSEVSMIAQDFATSQGLEVKPMAEFVGNDYSTVIEFWDTAVHPLGCITVNIRFDNLAKADQHIMMLVVFSI